MTSSPRISPRSTARSVSCVQRCCDSSRRPELVLQLAQQRLHVARDRAQLRRRVRRRPQDALAAQQRAQPGDPAPPRQLRDDDGDQRDARRQRREEVEEVPARLLAAALDEAHVVHEHELGALRRVAGERPHGDVQRRPSRCRSRCSPTVRYGASAEQRSSGGNAPVAIGADVSERQSPTAYRRSSLVSRWKNARIRVVEPVAISSSSGSCRVAGDQVRPDVEVAHEPARHQRVDERHRRVREQRERDQQRNEKAKRQAHEGNYPPRAGGGDFRVLQC